MLFTYLFIGILLMLPYSVLLIWYVYSFSKLPNTEPAPPDFQPKTRFLFLCIARNEAANIETLMDGLYHQDYPKELLEICLVDDNSEDNTFVLAQEYAKRNKAFRGRIESAPLDLQGKKPNIEKQVNQTTQDWVIMTDADCRLPKDLVKNMAFQVEQNNPIGIAGPVKLSYSPSSSLLERFQSLDFSGMQLITAACTHNQTMQMANGANLAFCRKAFLEVDGYKGNLLRLSGDDMHLFQKLAHKKRKAPQPNILYLKNNDLATLTPAVSTLPDFVQQRLRWGSKSGTYIQLNTLIMLGIVWATCLILALLPLLLLVENQLKYTLLVSYLIKIGIDFILLKKATTFFNQAQLLHCKTFLPSVFIHTYYIATIGLLANLPLKYTWKNRKGLK